MCVVFYFKESRRYYLWCEIKITNNKKCYFADFFAFWYICNRVYFQGNKSCCTQCWLLLLFHAGSSFIFSGHASHVACGSIRRRLGSSSSPSSTPTWPNKPESVRVVVCKKILSRTKKEDPSDINVKTKRKTYLKELFHIWNYTK